MRKLAICMAMLLVGGLSMAKELTVERIYSDPELTGPAPRQIKVSPDGLRVTYLKNQLEDANRYDLWEYHIEDKESRLLVDSADLMPGDEVLSDEEKARRERQRLFATGIVSYFWSRDGKALVFPLGGDIFHYDLSKDRNEATRQLTDTEAFETDIKLSPDGSMVSFIRDQNLFVVNISTGKETQLTSDGGGVIKNAMAEFVAQEEMGRYTGYWWSPDSSQIAFARVDESPVAVEQRYEINADSFSVFEQRYPATGTDNVLVTLGVIKLGNDQPVTWLDLGKETDIYLARVNWAPDSDTLAVQRQSRDQQQLDLIFFSVKKGTQKTVVTETSPTWINLNNDLTFLDDQPYFVWASERSGQRHLYLYDMNGKLAQTLTSGDWMVNESLGIDEQEDAAIAYFEANKTSPLERHLYKVTFNAQMVGDLEQVTKQSGNHNISLAGAKNVYVDHFSSTSTPPQVSLHDITGERLVFLEENKLDQSHPYWEYSKTEAKAEFGTIKADDGTTLYYRMYKPADFDESKKYPVLVYTYGGPGSQQVQNVWAARNGYWFKMMAAKGFLVFTLDNRGSANRGKAFEDHLYRRLGNVEVTDQVAGAKFLQSLPYVDGEKIGVFGWSYGGYMTLLLTMQHPDIFRAGVSVAPVTDWLLYDTHYTERFLGHPGENAEGYTASNVFPYVDGLSGDLLIVHGMADDNVLFTNSTKLFKVLQDKNKRFEMMNYPGSKHSIWGQKVRTHLFNTITDFFDENLLED